MWKILKIAGVYVGIIIGAGFASGREITSFFTVYGEKWILGIILTGILFSLLGWGILDIIRERRVKSYNEFMAIIFGKKKGSFMEWISGIFLCVLFFTMAAAAGATGKEAFGMNYGSGVLFCIVFCFIIFLFDTKGVIIINGILSPLMIISGIIIGIYTLFMQTMGVFASGSTLIDSNWRWIFSSILYVSYNIITAVTVLVSMNELISTKKIAVCAGMLGGICMCLLGICIGAVMYIHYEEIKLLEIPMMAVVAKYSIVMRWIYIFMLISAILTTAVGNGFGAIKWLEEKFNVRGVKIKVLFLCGSAMFSMIGFSGFVERIYPLFGYLGLIQILFISLYFLNRKRRI